MANKLKKQPSSIHMDKDKKHETDTDLIKEMINVLPESPKFMREPSGAFKEDIKDQKE